MVYFISDLHFFHDRKFIYEPRGFKSEKEMREYYVKEWQKTATNDDDIYVAGDFCLGTDYDAIADLVKSLPGRIHIIIGNHDTDKKVEFYSKLPNVVEIAYATMIVNNNRRYYISHYITETATLESNPKTCVINIHGHLHVKEMFHEDKPYLINVSVDVTGGKLLTFQDIEFAFTNKIKECISYL